MNKILGLFLLCFSMMTNAADSMRMDVNASKTSFTIKLGANPSTGFEWKVMQFDKNLLTLTASHYQAPQTQLIGGGGQMSFTFTLNEGKVYPARTIITLKYGRAWEPNGGTVKNVSVHFVKGK